MVQTVSSQDQPLSKIKYHFDPRFGDILTPDIASIITKAGELSIAQSIDAYETSRYYGAYRSGELIAYMTVSRGDLNDENIVLPHWWVGYTIVERRNRGSGLTRALIEWWVQHHGEPLLSDIGQTAEAQGVWRSMMVDEPMLRFQIWERETGRFRDVNASKSGVSPNPWDGSPNRIVALPPTDSTGG